MRNHRFITLPVICLLAAGSSVAAEFPVSPRPSTQQDFSRDILKSTDELPAPPEVFMSVSPDDPDMDGLTTAIENSIGTDPLNIDSDCDGKDDGSEVGANPNIPTDTDSDNKIDALESAVVDSDGDSTPDETDGSTSVWQLSCLYFRPFAVKNDQSDSTAVEVRIVGAINPTVVKLLRPVDPPEWCPPFCRPDDVLVNGTGTDELGGITLFDDGSNGDRVANDGIWSRNTITSTGAVIGDGVFVTNEKTGTRPFDRVEVSDDSGTGIRSDPGGELVRLAIVRPEDVTPPVTHTTPPGGSPSQRTSNLINLVSPEGMLTVRRYLIGSPQFTNADTRSRLMLLTKDFYKTFDDDFDFFIAFNEFPAPGGVAGIHTGVRNEVDGIGKDTFDISDQFGSAGQLRAVIGTDSSSGIGPTNHEVMHLWGIDLPTALGFQNCSNDSHWGYVGVGQGLLGGIDMISDRDPEPEPEPDPERFCFSGIPNCCGSEFVPIELYLMGLVPFTDVPDITTLVNPVCDSVIRFDDGCPDGPEPFPGFPGDPLDSILADSTDTMTIEDVIAVVEPRTGPSPTAFSAALVAVTQYTLNDSEMAFFNVASEIWGAATGSGSAKSFAESTGARATMDTTVPAPPPLVCDENLLLQGEVDGPQNYLVKTTLTLGPNLTVDGDVTATVGQNAVFRNDTTIGGNFGLAIDPTICPDP